jgi:hypothetical protein
VLRSTWILLLLTSLASGCSEAPTPQAEAPAQRAKPAPPADAKVVPRKGTPPAATRGIPATSPSTGEPVEVHRTR